MVHTLNPGNLHPQPRGVLKALPARHFRESGIGIPALVQLARRRKAQIVGGAAKLIGITGIQLDIAGTAVHFLQLLQKFFGVNRLVGSGFLEDPGNPFHALRPRLLGIDCVAGAGLGFPGKGTSQIGSGLGLHKLHFTSSFLQRMPKTAAGYPFFKRGAGFCVVPGAAHHVIGNFYRRVRGKTVCQPAGHIMQPLRVAGKGDSQLRRFLRVGAANRIAPLQKQFEILFLAPAHRVDEHHGKVFAGGLRGAETAGLRHDQVRRVHVIRHVLRVAQYPHFRVMQIRHGFSQFVISAADGHHRGILRERPGQVFPQLADGAAAHTAAHQQRHISLFR